MVHFSILQMLGSASMSTLLTLIATTCISSDHSSMVSTATLSVSHISIQVQSKVIQSHNTDANFSTSINTSINNHTTKKGRNTRINSKWLVKASFKTGNLKMQAIFILRLRWWPKQDSSMFDIFCQEQISREIISRDRQT